MKEFARYLVFGCWIVTGVWLFALAGCDDSLIEHYEPNQVIGDACDTIFFWNPNWIDLEINPNLESQLFIDLTRVWCREHGGTLTFTFDLDDMNDDFRREIYDIWSKYHPNDVKLKKLR